MMIQSGFLSPIEHYRFCVYRLHDDCDTTFFLMRKTKHCGHIMTMHIRTALLAAGKKKKYNPNMDNNLSDG